MDWVNIGSDNGFSPFHQAIIWTNAGILLIGPLRTNFSEILIEIHVFSFKKIHLKMLSAKMVPSCPGGDELTNKHTWTFLCTIYQNKLESEFHNFMHLQIPLQHWGASQYKYVVLPV